MVQCSICCQRRKKVYQLCQTCTKDDAKRICLKCYSNMLYMCPAKTNCIALHLKCCYCATPMSEKELKSSVLTESVHYLNKANELMRAHLEQVVIDRYDFLDVIECQDRLLRFFTRVFKKKSPVLSMHFEAIKEHVNDLLVERARR